LSGFEDEMARAERLTAITQRVGFALWQLQELESSSAQCFVLIGQAKRGMGEKAGQELLDAALSKTFGATVQRLNKAGILPDALSAKFGDLLQERNWLVHRSRAGSRDAIHSDEAAMKLIARLDQMVSEAGSLLTEMGNLAEQHVLSMGVSSAEIEARTEAMLDQWHGGQNEI
jgi:hypothetical protein